MFTFCCNSSATLVTCLDSMLILLKKTIARYKCKMFLLDAHCIKPMDIKLYCLLYHNNMFTMQKSFVLREHKRRGCVAGTQR